MSNEYKFKGAYDPNTFFDAFTKQPSNDNFVQIGGKYMDANNVKKVEKFKKKLAGRKQNG